MSKAGISTVENFIRRPDKKFFVWHHSGRIRSGTVFDEMKSARFNLKNKLQFCRNNEIKLGKAKLLSRFHSGSKSNFGLKLGIWRRRIIILANA